MAELDANRTQPILVRGDQPLIGIPLKVNGEDVVRYFTDEQSVGEASTSASVQRALSLAGAWKDLGDWNDTFDEVDRNPNIGRP